jgi:hypothetical protein
MELLEQHAIKRISYRELQRSSRTHGARSDRVAIRPPSRRRKARAASLIREVA